MSEKSRKSEDHSNILKPNRGTAAASGLPQLGGTPGMVPHHSPYSLPPDGISLHPSHPLTYGIMRPSIGLRPGPMSNDLGPPIFMPSLNLGVPKQQQQHSAPTISQPPSLQTNTKSKHNNITQNTAFMQDIMFPSVFHATPMPPHGVPTSYIAHQSTPLPSTMKQQQLPPPPPTNSMGKPSSLSSAGPPPSSKSGTAVVRPTPKIQSSTPTSKSITSSNSKGEVPNASGMTYAPPYFSASHPGLISSAPTHSMGTLSKMLMSPASQQTPPTTGRQTKGLGTEVYGHTSAGQQGGVAVSKPGGQKLSSYPNSSVDGYSLSGRGPLMGQMVASTLTTSGQATSTATFTDTKVERPPQPSAALSQQPPPSSVSSAAAGSQTQPPSSRGEKLTTAEKASNIIISVPGLTGKHIAAITNNTTSVQQSDEASHSAYTSSPISQPGLTNHHSSTVTKPSSGEYVVNQPLTPEAGWGVHPQQKTNMMFHSPLPPGHPSVGGTNSSSGQGYVSGGIPPATHISGVAMTTSGSSPHTHPPPGPGSNVMGSPGSHTLSSPNSSPRPRILRTKRPLDGSWKMDGQTNTSHNPGSPLFSKLRQDLGAAKSLRSLSSSYQSGTGGFRDETVPLSPTSSEADTPHSNHVGSVKIEPNDLTASPRKKPRKQHVVANDDQYASNVPDGFHVKSDPLSSIEGSHWHLTEELRRPTTHHNSVTTRSHRSRGEGSGMDGKDDMFYLSQLRRCPYPINGVYKVHHKAARNHFRRHADIKHREEEKINVYEIASNKKSWERCRGWKLQHFSTQLDEMLRVEDEILEVMERLEASVNNLERTSTCQLDEECVESFREMLQGNFDRSKRTKTHIDATKSEIYKVLENHQPQVRDILTKLVGREPPHPLEQLGLLHRNQTFK